MAEQEIALVMILGIRLVRGLLVLALKVEMVGFLLAAAARTEQLVSEEMVAAQHFQHLLAAAVVVVTSVVVAGVATTACFPMALAVVVVVVAHSLRKLRLPLNKFHLQMKMRPTHPMWIMAVAQR
jgi:hypothetical protein